MAEVSSTILVVDDYIDNRVLLAAWLRAKGYKVVEAQDGKEGVLQANRSHPDLILMDLAMPELDGIEATRQLRERHAFSRTPIFAISAYATHDVKETRSRPAAQKSSTSRSICPYCWAKSRERCINLHRRTTDRRGADAYFSSCRSIANPRIILSKSDAISPARLE
jgi:CheY-like chemotaxis protein